MGLLDDKVAVITGAGRGLGRAYALHFAKNGARVVVCDSGAGVDGAGRDEAPAATVVAEIDALVGKGRAIATFESVSEQAAAERTIRAAVQAFGRVDALVNNAGIKGHASFLKVTEADVDALFSVHVKGTLFTSQAFVREVLAQKSAGRIVNTVSTAGLLGNFGQAAYAAAKGAVYALTRTMSIELQKHRITVNALAPMAKTRLTEDLPMYQGVDSLTPEHVAPAALYLASDLVGDRTGHVLAVAGARMYALKLVESNGRFKEGDDGVWGAEEIREHWDVIVRG